MYTPFTIMEQLVCKLLAVAGKFTGGRQAVGKHMIAMECKEIRGGYNDLKKEERN